MRSFRTAVFTLLAGSAGAQVVTLLMAPMLARVFRAQDFGTWALFVAVATLAGAISSARYDVAVLLPRSSTESMRLSALAFANVCFLTALISIGTCISYWMLGLSFNGWRYLPACVFFAGTTQILVALLIRRGSFRAVSSTRLSQSVTVALFNLGGMLLHQIGVLPPDGETLVVATVAGHITAAMVAGFYITLNRIKITLACYNYDKALISKYRDFPLFSMPEVALGTVASSLPVYIFTYLWDESVAGQYSLAYRCLMLPIAVIGGAMGQVNLREFTRLRAAGEPIGRHMVQAWRRAAVWGILPCVGVLALGERSFLVLFGPQWDLAGSMATALALPMFVTFILSVGSGAHVALRLQHLSLFAAVSTVLIKTAAALTIGIGTPITILMFFVAVDLAVSILLNAYAWRYSGAPNNA